MGRVVGGHIHTPYDNTLQPSGGHLLGEAAPVVGPAAIHLWTASTLTQAGAGFRSQGSGMQRIPVRALWLPVLICRAADMMATAVVRGT